MDQLNPQACLSFPKRRLCNAVGGRFIDGAPRCCAVCTARSRAAAITNFARSNQSWVLRALFAGAKSCTLVNFFMICPQWSTGGLAGHDEILPLITAISWRTPTHGYEATREAAMAAFAKS